MGNLSTGLLAYARANPETGLIVRLVKLQLQNLVNTTGRYSGPGPEKPGNPQLEYVTTRLEIISMQLYSLATKSLFGG